MAGQHARPVGVVVVVPITCCSCRATGDEVAFRGERVEGLRAVGDAVGVVRIDDGWPLSRVRRL